MNSESNFLKTGRFRPRAVPLRPADVTPLPKNYLHGFGLVLNVIFKGKGTFLSDMFVFKYGMVLGGAVW
jgi:hypothetical protein